MNQKLSRRTIAKAIAARLVDEPARRSHWVKVLAAYVVEQKLVGSIDLVLNDVLREIFALDGRLLAEVTTARPMQDAVRNELKAALRDQLDAKDVVLQEVINNELLGGFVVRTPDAIMDTSVRTKLNQLRSLA